MEAERQLIEVNVTIDRVMFYNAESMWGVYAALPNNNHSIELNAYGNFVITGGSARLNEGDSYDIVIEPTVHKKYGDGYNLVSVEAKRPSSIKEQQDYVKALVTESRYEAIIEVYPNHPLVDMFESHQIDYKKIKGFGEATYNKVRKELLQNLEIQEALVELKEFDITFIAMKKLIDHYGSAAKLAQKIKENIYNLCKVDNFGFKKVDAYAMNRGDDPENPNRIESAIIYVLEQDASKGNSWISELELVEELDLLLQIDLEVIENFIETIVNNNEEHKDIYIDGNKIALQKNYYFESKIKEKLIDMLNKPSATKVEDTQNRIEFQEGMIGFTFTSEQADAIKLAIDNNVLAINGKGGTGKSSIMRGLVGVLDDYTYMSCSLSGKAAKVLSNQGLEAMTIHRMLGVNPNGGFKHNDKNRLPYDIVILDEASMANNFLIYSVLVALKDDAKMIFVGDNGQLPSIGTGAIFDDILTTDFVPKQELTQVHRQAAKSGILSTANQIREGEKVTGRYNYEQETIGELRDMTIIPVDKETDIVDMVERISERNKDADLYDFQVITGLRERGELSVKNLNNTLQKVFNDISQPSISRNGYDYRVGDKIIHSGNNYEAGENEDVSIFNGTMGKIIHIEFDLDKSKQNHMIHIQFEDIDEVIKYSVSDMSKIELAYAITTHRSQGQSIKNVIFVFDFSSYMLLSREFVYTGITRASEGCIMICENGALHHAIETVAGGSRRTFLKEMLAELTV